jgi:hypothetical protein
MQRRRQNYEFVRRRCCLAQVQHITQSNKNKYSDVKRNRSHLGSLSRQEIYLAAPPQKRKFRADGEP